MRYKLTVHFDPDLEEYDMEYLVEAIEQAGGYVFDCNPDPEEDDE